MGSSHGVCHDGDEVSAASQSTFDVVDDADAAVAAFHLGHGMCRRTGKIPVSDGDGYSRRVFDPSTISEDACLDGHLDSDPIYAVLLSLGAKVVTGRLTIADAAGDNHMYFMQGRPVGVHLAEHFHPLGQLLLELGRMTGGVFVRAQRLIAEGNRLPGQVYKELGILDDQSLKDVLSIQARRKAEHFCRLGSRPFRFCRGLTYLTGFTSTPLDPHAVIFLAVRQQMGEQARESFLEGARGEQVRLVPPGGPFGGPSIDTLGLPGPLASYGFGPPEERFLQRIFNGWEDVAEIAETGTLPRDEMAVLLRYLEVIGRLHRRPVPPPLPRIPTPTPVDAVLPTQPFVAAVASGQRAAPPPSFPASFTPSAPLAARGSELEALQRAPLTEPTNDDVFSRPSSAVVSAPVAAGFSTPDALTDPRRPATRKEELMNPRPADDAFVFASAAQGRTPQPSPAVSSVMVSEELPPPVVKKKKVKRLEPLPSEASGVLMSETRHEKAMLSELPSIVIDDD